jgi:hypothetical protein
MRNQIYHTVGTVPKSNRKIAEGGNINTPNTLFHGRNKLLYNQYREKPTQIEVANSTQFKSTTLIIAAIIDEDRLLQCRVAYKVITSL